VLDDLLAEARVFVIDDHPSNVALLQAVLTRAGIHRIFTETDSRQVLPRLGEVDPDLIVLDLHMPHLDGFAVLAQIREYAPSDYLPVLVLTADTTATASERALSAGAQDFVTKPFNNSEVVLRARNLLETRFLYTSLRSSIVRQAGDRLREERRLSEALFTEREAVERLQHLDGVKDTMLQTISHDLRNPISAVLVMTGMLAADATGSQPLSPQVRSTLIAKVETSVQRMDRLLTDLLDSDPMRGPADRLLACDVGELVRRVLASLDIAQEHPVETDIRSVSAIIDPVHVERIVENLLANARNHLAPGVPIWVKTGPLDDGVLITVEDAGPGIPADLVDSLFQPFRRGADAGSDGMGLGLWLVSRFAQLHGGRAWVDQRSGGGASFRVYLPARMEKHDPAGTAESSGVHSRA
jgi:signal transduction histidine kinase